MLFSKSILLKICLIALIASIAIVLADEVIVKCDKLEREGSYHVCFVEESGISTPNTIVRTNSEIKSETKSLTLIDSKIKFLPVRVAEEFPELKFYATLGGGFDKVEKKHFKNLKNLKFLTIRSEKLKNIPKNTFEDVQNLISLDISGTSIEYFHSDTFKLLTQLGELYLGSNNIQIIHPHALDTLVNLRYLSIKSNNLLTLSPQLFRNKNKLSDINAKDNKFVYLSDTTFNGLKLERLDLKPAEGSQCRLETYEDDERIDLDKVKRDINNRCKGNDRKIQEVNTKIQKIVKKYGDVLN